MTLIKNLFLTLIIISQNSLAQEKKEDVIVLEDIMIQGHLSERDYYSDPTSTSILKSTDFLDRQATHFEDLIQAVPNINATKGSSRARYFTIRGIGERAAYEGMPNYSVGIIIDDIDYSGSGGVSDLGGVSQVEVFKGPQATRMGPSALAGMIYMTTQAPRDFSEGSLLLSVESFNTFREQFFYTSPINKNIGTSLSLSKVDSDGFIENTYLDRNETSGLDELSIKSKTVYKKENVKGTLSIHHHRFNNGYDYFSQDNSLKTQSDKPGEDDQNILAGSIRFEYGSKKLKHITLFSHLSDETFYSYDEDWGNNELWNSVPGYNANYDYNIEFSKQRKHYYVEQRMILNGDFILGLYHKNAHERFIEKAFQDEAQRKNVSANFQTQNNAIYLQNTNKIAPKQFLEYGVRFENRQADYIDSDANEFNPSEHMNGGNLTWRLQQDERNMRFITLAKGFKAGGFNTQSNVEASRKSFEQESAYNIEFGAKNFWNEELSSSLSFFYMQRENVQVRTSYQDDPTDPSSYTFYTDNATSGQSYGFELEIGYFMNKGFEMQTNLSMIHTEYNDFEFADTNLKGRAYPNAPGYTINTLLRYQWSDHYFISTNIFMSDGFYYSNSHDKTHPQYEQVDLTLGYTHPKWDISVWSKNILDEEIYARGFFFANEPPDWEEALYTQLSAPRTFGITAKYKFN